MEESSNQKFLDEMIRELKDIAENTCDPHVTEALEKLIRRILGE